MAGYGYGYFQGGVPIGSKVSLLENYIDKMDYWATGLDTDLLSLNTEVGTGGALKQLPAVNIASSDCYSAQNDEYLMMDDTAVYEYYLETIIESYQPNTLIYFMTTTVYGNPGWRLSKEGATGRGFYFYNFDASGKQSNLNKLSETCFNLGLNKIKITINHPTKEITIQVNDSTYSYTHTLTSIKSVTGGEFSLGYIYNNSSEQKPVYFSIKKNGVVTKEIVCGNIYGFDGVFPRMLDLIGGKPLGKKLGTPTKTSQDLINPYRNGYDLYWVEDTLKYRGVSPVSELSSSANPNTYLDGYSDDPFDLFKKINSNEIGYHGVNYLEMPDLAIFDTTNRTYWKVSIESDPYYVGGTVGKERWFHRTWLDYDWLNTHIEDAHKYKIFVQLRWKKATGHDYVKVKIENIVLFNTVPNYYKSRRDIYETESISNLYQSFNARANNGIRYKTMDIKGSKFVILDGNFLRYSSDYGKTFNTGVDISATYPALEISQVRITNNGNICIFSTKTSVHYSNDNLTTITASSVVNEDNSPYVFHTPANASYPGGYFQLLNSFVETDDCLVIANYSNSATGACPTNFYYSIDNGATWKVFYTYGQNSNYTDDGTSTGGTGGTLLGDAGNSIITTRVEAVNIGNDGNVYIATEGTAPGGTIMKCEYDLNLDSWQVTSLLNSTYRSLKRMRANGAYEHNGYIYWAPVNQNSTFEHEGQTYSCNGIYKCLVGEINDLTKHIQVHTPSVGVDYNYVFLYNSGKVYAGMVSEVHLSSDHGKTWEKFDNKFNSNLLPTRYDAESDLFFSVRDIVMKYLK